MTADDAVGLALALAGAAAGWVLIGREQKRHGPLAWRWPVAKKMLAFAAIVWAIFMAGVALDLWR